MSYPRVPRPLGTGATSAGGLSSSVMPDTLRRTIRYSDYAALPGTTGALSSWIFAANGLYDPDTSIGGHQPMGYDQLMVFYNRYTVLSARITVDFIAVSVPIFAGICASSVGSAAYSSYNSYIESGFTSFRILEDPTPGRNRISLTLDIAKFLGAVDLLDGVEHSGGASTNPTQLAYFHVLAQDVNKTSTANAEVNVTIDFDVVFTWPKVLPTS